MLLISGASCLLSATALRPAVAAQPGPAAPAAPAVGGTVARDSAAVVRAARTALRRYLRGLGEPSPRYRVVAVTRDSVGATVSFTSCRARPCVDGGSRVLVRPDGRAEVLAIR